MLLVSMDKFAITEMGSTNSDSLSIASFRPMASEESGCLRRLSLNRFSRVWLFASRNTISVGRDLLFKSLIIMGNLSRSADIFLASILTATLGMPMASEDILSASEDNRLAGRLSMQ